jgi:hypothetical protein
MSEAEPPRLVDDARSTRGDDDREEVKEVKKEEIRREEITPDGRTVEKVEKRTEKEEFRTDDKHRHHEPDDVEHVRRTTTSQLSSHVGKATASSGARSARWKKSAGRCGTTAGRTGGGSRRSTDAEAVGIGIWSYGSTSTVIIMTIMAVIITTITIVGLGRSSAWNRIEKVGWLWFEAEIRGWQ